MPTPEEYIEAGRRLNAQPIPKPTHVWYAPGPPSPYLSWAELACKDGTPYPAEWVSTRLPELVKAFERVRAIYGAPILISNAYRTPEFNRLINGGKGGAKLSQHCEGRALDLAPAKGGPQALAKLRSAVIQARQEGFLRGVGIYRNFVHMDTRPAKNATWYGDRGLEGNIA